ncbi:hypothetical protein DFP72DRAFT_1080674 [Ephemerocybe angulata]|uniref:Uncharacterized protein n=1 Tax=Ephemerocybe angulata TaxID=980116 RepID=A0A8H6LTG6_9AGAR|nr:hypothetical protein DFP72DRAFT_1080674 [Tulosesus angulatus]
MPLLPSKPSISPPTLSSFELFLFRAPARAVECLLNWMDEADIVRLSELGTKMFYWVHAYSRRTWNFEDFIGLYMSNPSTFLGFFNGTDAMIYGKSVFRFFLRSPHPTCPLDHPLDEKMPDGSIKIKGIEVLALLHDSIVPTIWHAPTNTSVEGDNIAEEVDLRVPFFPNGAV